MGYFFVKRVATPREWGHYKARVTEPMNLLVTSDNVIVDVQ